MANYDVIGDVHGHARQLRGLLGTLGYVERDGAYRHAERRAVFIGDLIDRGPEQVEALRIARAMVDAAQVSVVVNGRRSREPVVARLRRCFRATRRSRQSRSW